MKTAFKNIFAGIALLAIYMILGYRHSGKFQGPSYIINVIVKAAIEDGNIFTAIFWQGCFVIAFTSIMLGMIGIARATIKKFSNKQPVDNTSNNN